MNYTGGLVVLGNQFARSSSGVYRQGGYWSTTTFQANQEVYATVRNAAKVATDAMALYVRTNQLTDGNADGYALDIFFNDPATAWYIRAFTNETYGASIGPVTQAIADGETVLFSAYGSVLTGYLLSGGTWSQVITLTDTTYNSPGYIGMELIRGQTWRATDFGGGGYQASGQTDVMIA